MPLPTSGEVAVYNHHSILNHCSVWLQTSLYGILLSDKHLKTISWAEIEKEFLAILENEFVVK